MSTKYNPLDEVVLKVESVLEQHGNPKLLLLGSYAKDENKYINHGENQTLSLSDLEFIIFCRKNKALINDLNIIDDYYQSKFGKYFKLDYDFISPSLRVLLLRNRLLFYEGYKFSRVRDWRMELVLLKPFNYTEANQTLLWRVFTLRKILKETQSGVLCTYFCARNILDLFLVYVYNQSLLYPSHRLRHDYLIENRLEINLYLPVRVLEKAFDSFHGVKNVQVNYVDFVSVFHGLSKYLISQEVTILPTFRDRMIRKIFGQIELRKSYNITKNEFFGDLLSLVDSSLNEGADAKFIMKYQQLFPYLKTYE
jgi:hypothetical protein